MKKEMMGSDAYLEQWNKGPRQNRDGSAEAVAKAVAEEFEGNFDSIRSDAIAKCGNG